MKRIAIFSFFLQGSSVLSRLMRSVVATFALGKGELVIFICKNCMG